MLDENKIVIPYNAGWDNFDEGGSTANRRSGGIDFENGSARRRPIDLPLHHHDPPGAEGGQGRANSLDLSQARKNFCRWRRLAGPFKPARRLSPRLKARIASRSREAKEEISPQTGGEVSQD
ncbi:hypothetical protein HPP92_004792 [Vanilla planifolia]|uniref:Uncharacterized protein n=1 Tax=Vanilla planifolia TaxID=51239 RepID=A0A835RTB1_VANPL|nr:hypothetical protein HPP92_005146 [Vanilla planifolia]KAG0493798.1 hypothetical protein HPP92_004792 [Vanilla planifolia]